MGMGRRPQDRQQEFWIASEALASVPKHVFYDKLNGLLDEAGFDWFVEELCEPFYADSGRHSIPPGRYFRMLFVGYFENSTPNAASPGGVRTVCRCDTFCFWKRPKSRPIIPA